MRLKWALAVTGLALAQQPQELPTIKVDISVVNILCSVRDNNGALVPNLAKDDFTVTEEGKSQEIRYFARETDLPLTLGLLVDVSGSQKNLIEVEKRAADQFFGKVLRKQDMAFLIGFGPEAELLQDSTSSVVLLRRGLDGLRLWTDASAQYPGPVPTVNRPRGTVLITDGVDVGSRLKLQDAIAAAQKADVIVYSIYYGDPGAYGLSGFGYSPGDGDLRRMSEDTGGRMFRVDRRNTLESIFQQIQDEMRSQYAIGYVPSGDAPPGSYRRVEVKTKQRGLKVQARKGYFTPKPES